MGRKAGENVRNSKGISTGLTDRAAKIQVKKNEAPEQKIRCSARTWKGGTELHEVVLKAAGRAELCIAA